MFGDFERAENIHLKQIFSFTNKGCPKKNGNFYTKALRKVVKKCDDRHVFFCSFFGILVDETFFSQVTSTNKNGNNASSW